MADGRLVLFSGVGLYEPGSASQDVGLSHEPPEATTLPSLFSLNRINRAQSLMNVSPGTVSIEATVPACILRKRVCVPAVTDK